MAHDHHHHHHHHHGHSHATDRLKSALWLNLSFTVIELVGGIWTGSVAILADAVHDLGDSLALGLAVVLERKSNQGPNATYSYGYKRFSLLSAWITGVVLVAGSAVVAVESVRRLLSGEFEPHGMGMIGLALLGVVVNGVAALRLRHGHTHNERMMSWHLIEDVLGWVAVLVGALFIEFAGVKWLDPVLAVAIAGFVGWNGLKNLLQVSLVFLQRLPGGFDKESFRREVLGLSGAQDVHDIHAWSLDGEHHVMSLHIVHAAEVDAGSLKKSVRQIAARYGSVHTTIETELATEVCAENCD